MLVTQKIMLVTQKIMLITQNHVGHTLTHKSGLDPIDFKSSLVILN